MIINELHTSGGNISNIAYADAIGRGIDKKEVGAALKKTAIQMIAQFAENYRKQVSSASAGKIAAYELKQSIASNPASASDTLLLLLDREADARGLDRNEMLAAIKLRADAYNEILLLIEAVEAEAIVTVSAISPDDITIETQIISALGSAKLEAEIAFVEVQKRIAKDE